MFLIIVEWQTGVPNKYIATGPKQINPPMFTVSCSILYVGY